MNEKRDAVRVDRILETCLYVDDLDAATVFYRDVLGLADFARVDGRHVFFRCGEAVLLVFNPRQTAQPIGDVPTHGALGPGHVAFAMRTHEVDTWRQRLLTSGVDIEAEITWPSGGLSLYFRDPAGNSVELTTPVTWGLQDSP